MQTMHIIHCYSTFKFIIAAEAIAILHFFKTLATVG